MIASTPAHKKVLGFSVLKNGSFLKQQTLDFLYAYEQTFHTRLAHKNFDLCLDYDFGGYAKVNNILNTFVQTFIKQHHIPIDPIYTGKMLYGIHDLIRKNFFNPYTTIIALHTGGVHNSASYYQ